MTTPPEGGPMRRRARTVRIAGSIVVVALVVVAAVTGLGGRRPPAHRVHTDTLRTPAMQSPHESLRLNQRRGLLVADMGYPTWNPGFVDVSSVTKDCRHPVPDSSTPMGLLGHESGFSPD